MNILDILKEIESESSTKRKEEILKKHSGNDLLKEIFRITYCKSVTFGIKQIPEIDQVISQHFKVDYTLRNAVDDLNNLFVTRKLTGNVAREKLKEMLCSLAFSDDPDSYEVLCRIINRDLKCGIGRTVPNKVWKGLIPKQPQMLCQPMNEKNLTRIKYPAYAQLKADGARCFMDVVYDTDNNTVEITMVSRQGNDYYKLDHIKQEMEDLILNKLFWHYPFDDHIIEFTIDGELVAVDENGNHTPREINNGILNKSLKNTISDEEAKSVKFMVWDFINKNDSVFKFITGLASDTPENDSPENNTIISNPNSLKGHEFSATTAIRYQMLGRMIDGLENFELIENTVVNNIDEAREIYQKYVDQGYEGIILKNMDAMWKDGRSNDQVKFKEEIMVDLKVVGFIENETYPNTLGSLMLQSADGKIEVNCGSGFTYTFQRKEKDGSVTLIPVEDRPVTDREWIWTHRDSLINTIVEVKCNGLTTSNGRETYSLFLPIFQQWREDKGEANNIEDVFEV